MPRGGGSSAPPSGADDGQRRRQRPRRRLRTAWLVALAAAAGLCASPAAAIDAKCSACSVVAVRLRRGAALPGAAKKHAPSAAPCPRCADASRAAWPRQGELRRVLDSVRRACFACARVSARRGLRSDAASAARARRRSRATRSTCAAAWTRRACATARLSTSSARLPSRCAPARVAARSRVASR
jgi:hypothetical protein